jgi:hypothetical protein
LLTGEWVADWHPGELLLPGSNQSPPCWRQ